MRALSDCLVIFFSFQQNVGRSALKKLGLKLIKSYFLKDEDCYFSTGVMFCDMCVDKYSTVGYNTYVMTQLGNN